jgi:hypothetical protein
MFKKQETDRKTDKAGLIRIKINPGPVKKVKTEYYYEQ